MITKSKILLNLQCPKRLWLSLHAEQLGIEVIDVNSNQQTGNEVGEIARTFHPNGYLVSDKNNKSAIKTTQEILVNTRDQVLFEAAFEFDEVLVRTDLLIPDDGQYRLEEVKSSTEVKSYHKQDAAIQAWVLNNSGYKTSSVSISHIDKHFIYKTRYDYHGLLFSEDVSQEVNQLIADVPKWVANAKATVQQEKEPIREIGRHCKDPFPCPFHDYCLPKNSKVKYPLSILPHANKLIETLSKDYQCLTEIPEERLTNNKHKRIVRTSKSGEPELDSEASQILQSLPYPWFFLDFETIAYAIPRWLGTKPYQQIPFQWSCHIKRTPDSTIKNIEHHDFLDLTGRDPREDFTVKLIKILEDKGTIFVYNEAFEKTRIRELQRDFPQYADALERINSRVFDLLKVARDHYYHPAMKGSWSIKKVLPTIDPSQSYKLLNISDGGMAQDEFRRALLPEISKEEQLKIDRDLRDYCSLDTLSMWRIMNLFLGFK